MKFKQLISSVKEVMLGWSIMFILTFSFVFFIKLIFDTSKLNFGIIIVWMIIDIILKYNKGDVK